MSEWIKSVAIAAGLDSLGTSWISTESTVVQNESLLQEMRSWRGC